ncbi:hypothetical protein DYB30_003408 [Aphanomyces astaci]|uniref:Uncharacterized protein n=1 Tax=Aphanomyces astaci TaxID=112090 RepID=A0A397E2X7_APHAT|nr:hypothetical protein DYB38_002407 [Aphanomyces astaci]RHY65378.1 hypothetical protein DYB34_006744 [Aphanomyces astaci]RHY72691.1 hypothetical protein DYB30_003408 [Aphanomyces astaci]RHZ39177.1 hypothetical protein DYB31_005751 [Aphanomyces astaci]
MESHAIMQRILDREFYRIEAALDKNFEYIDRLDREREDALARAQVRITSGGGDGGGSRHKKETSAGVYITGLTTYIACKQLETLCHRLGRVKRIKFYKDERGSLKPVENTLDEPSRSVVLRGILDEDPHEAPLSDEYLDVEDDLRLECSNFGTVLQVPYSAVACLRAMHGRWFGRQQIRASFDPTKPETNVDDPDLMLQAFLASV